MCGIFGYAFTGVPVTMRQIVAMLTGGLKRLEYRGYDSAGICVDGTLLDAKTGAATPYIIKSKGFVAALEAKAMADTHLQLDETRMLGSAIAHTRWATHGPPCDINAHPQSSGGPQHAFVLIHNGIMTNYAEMKKFLSDKGYAFESETDTEVIAKLAAYLYSQHTAKPTFAQLVREVMQLTQGAFALAIKSVYYPGELIGCRRGSPLILGIRRAGATSNSVISLAEAPEGPSEYFLASDAQAIIEHTKQVVYLDDGDLVHIHGGHVHIFNDRNLPTDASAPTPEIRAVREVELQLEALSKGGYEHFMLKEICEQSESVINSMRGRVNWEQNRIMMGGFATTKHLLRTARRLIFISCGTSFNACLAVRPLFDEMSPCPVELENANDFLDRRPKIFRDDVCIFVSQSGETADTLMALEYCEQRGASLVGFTNTVGSSISRRTQFGAHLNAGPEIGVASTKAYTSQIVTMVLVALILSDDTISMIERRAEIIKGLAALSGHVSEALTSTEATIKALALKLKESKSVLVLGRGYQLATAFEAALKIKELTYVHTEGINAGELKHGPLALIDEHIPVLIICTKDSIVERVRACVQQIKARNGRPIVVLSQADPEVESLADEVIRVPSTVDCLQSVVNAIPLQLLAYHMAVARGNNVDRPRNLAKSVTVQ